MTSSHEAGGDQQSMTALSASLYVFPGVALCGKRTNVVLRSDGTSNYPLPVDGTSVGDVSAVAAGIRRLHASERTGVPYGPIAYQDAMLDNPDGRYAVVIDHGYPGDDQEVDMSGGSGSKPGLRLAAYGVLFLWGEDAIIKEYGFASGMKHDKPLYAAVVQVLLRELLADDVDPMHTLKLRSRRPSRAFRDVMRALGMGSIANSDGTVSGSYIHGKVGEVLQRCSYPYRVPILPQDTRGRA